MLLGAHLTLMMGPVVAVPAPPPLAEALASVEVTHTDQGKSGFQLQFQVGRSGPQDLFDFPLANHPLLRPFTRVVLVVRFNLLPRVLMDGVITQVSLAPSETPGASTLSVTGEDVSVMMDLVQKSIPYPAMSEMAIVPIVLAQYAMYGITPLVVPPVSVDTPSPLERVPQQNMTDLAFLEQMARRYGYVFYLKPGPAPLQNVAYWGPRLRAGPVQKALSVNMGPATNVSSVSFQFNALSPTMVIDRVPIRGVPVPVIAPPLSTRPPLAAIPAVATNGGRTRLTLLVRADEEPEADDDDETVVGLNYVRALIRAMGTVETSLERVVTASGELDALQYGEVLEARGIVGLRGAGFTNDGLYYVQSVTHSIRRGEYKQRFSLAREGTGSLLPVVRP